MATANQCATCEKERAIAKCAGCLQNFCLNHLTKHRQQLTKEFDELETSRDLFRQTLIQQTTEPRRHPLIQQIDQWEEESINKIRQTAEEARLLLITYTNEHVIQLEKKMTQLTEQLRQSRQMDDIIETDLKIWKEELTQLTEHFNKPPHVTIQQREKALINEIGVDKFAERDNHASLMAGKKSHDSYSFITFCFLVASLVLPTIDVNVKWVQNGITVAGGNGQGHELNQLSDPWGIYVYDDQTIYIADRSNHRIVEWKNNAARGQIVAGGNGEGFRTDQLNRPINVIVDKMNDCLIICDYGNRRVVRWPRQNGTCGETIISNISCWGLTMDNQGYLYVSDVSKHEVRRYGINDTNGTVIAGGNGRGKQLDQFNGPYYIAVDQTRSLYVSDCNNHRVMKWKEGAKRGVAIAGDQDYGKGMTEFAGPYGVIVDQLGTVYIADCNNNRLMRWVKGATEGSVVVGGNGLGRRANQFHSPCDLSFDRQNSLYVVDTGNHRVQKFIIEPNSAT
jgi:sugar lactone lactonase YvrE